MISSSTRPVFFVLAAAFLFGSSTSMAKLALAGIAPITLASIIYLGSGGGMAVYRLFRYFRGIAVEDPPLTRSSIPWVIGASFFGAVLATTSLTLSLRTVTAWEASVLLSFEAVATALVARVISGERAGPRVWTALGCITLACIILAWRPDQMLGISIGAVGILFTCLCWGVDTSCSRQIAGRNPLEIVMYKGLFAGVITFAISRVIGEPLPGAGPAVVAAIIGMTGFGGLMTFCFLRGLRDLGPARTGSFFGINPVFGIIVGLVIFRDIPGLIFIPPVGLMLTGIAILLTEHHNHLHRHSPDVHNHRHGHDDGHHDHKHPKGILPAGLDGYHTHLHSHQDLIHEHEHTPDIHHQHQHTH